MIIKFEKNVLIKNPETKDFLADVYYPETHEKLPLLIFAHGYKGYKDWGAWNLMAEKFAEAGFFFVKFNFSHNGTTPHKPTEFVDLEAFGNNNFSKEMSDYGAVLNEFLKNPKIDPGKVALIGHSRGGGISLVKAFEDKRVNILVTLAGVSNFKYRFPSGERLRKWENTGVMFSENSRTGQQMPHYWQFYEDFRENERRFDLQYCAQHLEKPYLIVQGTEDNAVKEKEAFLLHEWGKNSTLELIENGDHTFGAKEPWKSEILPAPLESVVETTIRFIHKNLAN